jgi:hypothetical protein
LHTLENKLSELRSSSHASDENIPQFALNGQSGQTTAEENLITNNESEASSDSSRPQIDDISNRDEAATATSSSVNTPVPTDQEVSLPPVEGREDILPEDQAPSEQEPDNSEDIFPEDQATPEQETDNSLAETENPTQPDASEEEHSYPMPDEQEQNDTPSASEDTNASTATENELESSPEARHEWWQERISSAQEASQNEPSEEETY